jgi:hemerythrin
MSIHWNEHLKLGHESIDTQHMEIFSQINNLSEKITEGADDIEIRDLINYLNIYAKKHFFDEEKLMVQYNYYGIHKQKKEHTQFKNEVDEIAQMLRKRVPAIDIALRMETTLLQYFMHHIIEVDREMADYINFQKKQTSP